MNTDILQYRISSRALWVVAMLVAAWAGQLLQSQVHLNHDVSYFAHMSGWLLDGRSLGRDVLDGNFPMVWGLFMPSALLTQAGLLSEPAAVRLVFWLYFLVSAALLVAVLERYPDAARHSSGGWIGSFLVVGALAPGFSFAQREYACVLFAMPYLAAASVRLNGETKLQPAIAIVIGILAGIGFAIKPYFLAVPAMIELLLLVRLGWRALFARPESLALGLTVFVYVVVAGLVWFDYLKSTVELSMATYWAYDSGNFQGIVQRFVRVAEPATFGLLVALISRSWNHHLTVLMVAGLGFAISYFVQSKGFVYHAYPVLVCSIAFLGASAAQALSKTSQAWRASRSLPSLALGLLVLLLTLVPVKRAHDDVARWYFIHNIAWGPTGQFRQAVIDAVNHFAPTRQSYFFAFSTHPFPGFPTASYTLADWSGRSIVEPFIPALARIDEVTDPKLRAKVLAAGELQKRMVIEDLERRPPAIVFAERQQARLGMNGAQFDDIAFYMTDPRFRRIWENYQEYPPMGPLRVFVLRAPNAGP